jgi:hypothetical protein
MPFNFGGGNTFTVDNSNVPLLAEERRNARRYPLELNLTWTVGLSRGGRLRGSGRTVNMSSHGLLFKGLPADFHRENALMELRINWPALLDGQVPLVLMVTGKTVRFGMNGCGIKITHTEFRTSKIQVLEATA